MKKKIKSKWISEEAYFSGLQEMRGLDYCFYNDKNWLSIISKQSIFKVKFIGSFIEGELMSLLPIIILNKRFINIIGSPVAGAFTEFLGPLFLQNIDDSNKSQIFSSQLDLLMKNQDLIEFRLKNNSHYNNLFSKDFKKKKFEYKERPSLEIDLTSGEEFIWKSFKGRARNSIRKAEKNNVAIKKVVPDNAWITSYYKSLR